MTEKGLVLTGDAIQQYIAYKYIELGTIVGLVLLLTGILLWLIYRETRR